MFVDSSQTVVIRFENRLAGNKSPGVLFVSVSNVLHMTLVVW